MCFCSTKWIDVGRMYAMEWNVPCTILLNHHTCFQPTVSMSVTYLMYDDSEYPYYVL